jgi:hypothetical protein
MRLVVLFEKLDQEAKPPWDRRTQLAKKLDLPLREP